MTSIDDLTTPVTTDEAKTSFYESLAVAGVDTTSWKPGSVVRTIIAVIAILFSATTQLIAELAKSAFLELAVGAWLTLVARYQYGVERLEATFGTGTLIITNTGGGVYDLDPGDLVVRNPDTDKTYTNAGVVHVGASSTQTITIIAQEAGSASTSAIGTVVELVTGLLNVSVVNPTAVVGSDEEEDGALKLRCRDKLGARSANGPADAHAGIARGARRADGTAIGVNRIRIVKDGKGNGYIYLATPSGVVTGDAEDPSTDLGVINDLIQRQAAPLGFTAHTLSATPRNFDCAYSVWMLDTSGLTPTQVQQKIALALGDYLKRVPIGGYVIDGQPGRVYLDDVRTAIKNAVPQIFHVTFATPSADVDMNALEFPVLGTITPLLIQTSQQRTM